MENNASESDVLIDSSVLERQEPSNDISSVFDSTNEVQDNYRKKSTLSRKQPNENIQSGITDSMTVSLIESAK